MFAYLIVAAVLPALIVTYQVIPCPGNLPSPQAIRIDGCDSSPCYFNQGDLIAYEIDFINTATTTTLTKTITATVLGVESEVPLPPPLNDGCYGLVGRGCPVGAGDSVTHAATVPVPPHIHDGVLATLRVEIINDPGLVVVCCIVETIIR